MKFIKNYQAYRFVSLNTQIILCMLMIILSLLLTTNASAKPRVVKVGIYNNSPKVFMNSANEADGIFIDILKNIAEKEQWKIEYVPCYWNQCLELLTSGKIDLMPDVAYSLERERTIDFNQSEVLHSWTQFFAKENTHIYTPFDLNGKRVALLEGSIQESFVSEWLINFGIQVQLVPVNSLDEVFTAVANNRADAGIANNFFGDLNASKYQLVSTSIVYQPVRLYFATGKMQNPELITAIDQSLSQWKNNPSSFYFQTIKKWKNDEANDIISSDEWKVFGALVTLLVFLVVLTIFLRMQIKKKMEKIHETQIQLSNERDLAQQYLDIAGVMLMVLDKQGCIRMMNKKGAAIVGLSEEQLIGVDWFANFIPKEKRKEIRQLFDELMQGKLQKLESYENEIVTFSGKNLLLSWHNTILTNQSGEIVGVLSSAEDITQVRKIEAELQIAATAFETQEGIVVANKDCVILKANQSFCKLIGFQDDEMVEKKIYSFHSNRYSPDFYQVVFDAVQKDSNWCGEIWLQRKDGTDQPFQVSISTVKNEQDVLTHFVCTYVDSTELRRSEDKIKHLAFFDQLTQLPNRALLLDRLRQLMTSSTRSKQFCSLLFIDLDNFKTLNDTLGHDMGDLLLQKVAKRLQSCVRESDTVARFGGDEFVILLASIHGAESEAASFTEVIGGKILAAMNLPFQLKDNSYRTTLSVGATIFCGDTYELDGLLKQADMAMYKAKDSGRNALRFFDPNMEVVVVKRAALEKDLRQALIENQFVLYYQAQIAGSQIIGVEALIRWNHPQRGMVSPLEFIPVAEEIGLIVPLGRWVIETACLQLAKWGNMEGFENLTIAVNVSAQQFSQQDFVDVVLETVAKTGAPINKLKLELTETILVNNVEDVVEKMFALKAKGIGFSLDDFGTGYSSLTYLKRLPLDQLKIDQSFVRDVLIDAHDAAIAKTIIALADSLSFGVIAEGVETIEQRDFLREAGCHAYQGYLLSKPIPIKDFELFLQVKNAH